MSKVEIAKTILIMVFLMVSWPILGPTNSDPCAVVMEPPVNSIDRLRP